MTHDSGSGMPSHSIVASVMAICTGLALGQLVGDSGTVCIVVRVGGLGPDLPHDVVDILSAPVRVPPLSVEIMGTIAWVWVHSCNQPFFLGL